MGEGNDRSFRTALDHRKRGQDILRIGDSYEYAVGVGAESHVWFPLAELDVPAN